MARSIGGDEAFELRARAPSAMKSDKPASSPDAGDHRRLELLLRQGLAADSGAAARKQGAALASSSQTSATDDEGQRRPGLSDPCNAEVCPSPGVSRPTVKPAALPVAEQSSRAGAVTGVGVTGPCVLAVSRGCFIAAPIATSGAVTRVGDRINTYVLQSVATHAGRRSAGRR